jgi:serine/threonine protein kinase
MSLPSGTRLGPYEILTPLAAGGMGEVYRSRDTRLNRTVAVKVLPAHLATCTEARRRFEREARAISSLNHPHICSLYDIGQQDGIDYLVMEYLEGETLAQRLRKGALSQDQALRYASQILDALDWAHRNGIVHRDLKPGNVMLTRDGAKLLDFGLAKLREVTAPDQTVSMTLTREGNIIGTFQYMAPEQLEAKDADQRTDIFAFGAVLYEMLMGRKAFDGQSKASLIAAIMTAEPPSLTKLRPLTSPALERIVRTCLVKAPEARWQSAHDVKLQLLWLQEDAGSPAELLKRSGWSRVVWGFALVALLCAVVLTLDRFRTGSAPVQTVRASILSSSNYFLEHTRSFSLCPDGTRLAFVGVGPDGIGRLWVRTFSASSAQQLSGTEGATSPFWSPDSRRVGFFAGGKLKTVDLASAAVRIVCESQSNPNRGGATWARNGTIVFAPFVFGPLYRVLDTGGVPTVVTSLSRKGSGQRHSWPFFLPDDSHFLYSVNESTPEDPQGDGIYVGSLDGSAPKLITSEAYQNAAFASGFLLYAQDRSLRARPFDPDRLQLNGTGISIADQELEEDRAFGHSEFSVSQNGVLVFQAFADSVSRLVWFDRNGKELSQIHEFGYRTPRLSPDGRFVAVSSDDAQNGKFLIRIYDLARGTSARLTEGDDDDFPVWSRDGKTIIYRAIEGQSNYLKQVPLDRSAPPQVLWKGDGFIRHLDCSTHGDVVFTSFGSEGPSLKVYSAGDQTVVPLPFAPGAEPRFSPDGRWIAYVQATGGGVVVQPYRGSGGRKEISTGNGAQPTWSRDGRQIFYVAPDRKMMAVDFDAKMKSAGAPRVVFQTRIIAPNFVATQYDVSADGGFLINSIPANYSSALTLLTGWTAQLKH